VDPAVESAVERLAANVGLNLIGELGLAAVIAHVVYLTRLAASAS
jgi:hypothetical protein